MFSSQNLNPQIKSNLTLSVRWVDGWVGGQMESCRLRLILTQVEVLVGIELSNKTLIRKEEILDSVFILKRAHRAETEFTKIE